LAVLERCAALGIEVAVLDLGWARTIGDWRPNPAKFPRGLRPIADRAHELGMKFGILMQRIGDYDAQQMADTQAAIAQYKHLRTIICGGKVIHLLPPRHNVEHHGRDWDAIQAVTPDQTRSVVMVYRALGGPPERTIRPRGLRPGATYTMRYADAGITATRTAEDILEQGLTVALEELSSEVIELEIRNAV
jgi:alpha-galactosidase